METSGTLSLKGFFKLLKQAIAGSQQDYTALSIRRAVFLLAIPMIMEMIMESVFAVVDIFFVGKLGNEAVATVGLTESVLSLVYSVAIGLSMAATALVARRVGEKNLDEAAHAGMQTIVFSVALSIVIAIVGVTFAEGILRLMGANDKMIAENIVYTRVMFGGNVVIMLLFLINGIFRGAGDASIAMRSLWIANICNIILCPLLIYGWGPVPALGLKGAAFATTFGRAMGVAYQMYRLFIKRGLLHFYASHIRPHKELLKQIVKIGSTGTIQFLVSSASWIFLARLMAGFHEAAMAGYQVSIRILIFFLLPAWGLSNAAATLVGQNLGAGKPERAEQSVITTGIYTTIFMAAVSLFFFLFGTPVVNFMNSDPLARHYAIQSLRIVSLGYVFFGIEMVTMNAFNGAGDTRTPTMVNLLAFWLFQIPLAWFLAERYFREPRGVFFAILISQLVAATLSYTLFKRGRWKTVKV
ncbi:MATE family efflux transporter [Mucilaginibacter sp. L3T2-6]|uniref:MATE family efflux transporter n=1 Tax=Mucilaginibacter sp. L3T2-6 TaxID=3062491 RepID=UPI002676F4EF|nr:MATE family efflux transporter [Mucilaginibacter sp. L3T2-6]MDO3642972.1 MATE family efflux transporter [Mucilaginibacter sp. L3T2-6]MDV6215297.1 MATE family efflux transporter [Mucilaginibacter sp. L3T2-6]